MDGLGFYNQRLGLLLSQCFLSFVIILGKKGLINSIFLSLIIITYIVFHCTNILDIVLNHIFLDNGLYLHLHLLDF